MTQWYGRPHKLRAPEIKKFTKESVVFGAFEDSRLVAMITLVPMRKISGLKGGIEHVMVREDFRRRGIAETLMRQVLAHAKKAGMGILFLTCDPPRVAAKALYEKLGFKKQDTYFYQLLL